MLFQGDHDFSWIETIEKHSIFQLGTDDWFEEHRKMEILNMSMHQAIQIHSGLDYFSEQLLSLHKVPALVSDLIVSECWRKKVFPLLQVTQYNHLKLYFILFHESILLNILEVLLYHKEAVLQLEDDVVDLIDYCHRRSIELNNWTLNDDDTIDLDTLDKNQLFNEPPEEHLKKQLKQLEFQMNIRTLSIQRFLTDFINELSLSSQQRILNGQLWILSLISLLEKRIWEKKKNQTLLVFEEGTWKEVKKEDQELLSKTEAQIWLSLYNLLVEPKCRKLFEYDQFRKETILKLLPLLTQTLKDQLPILNQLHRCLEELNIIQVPPQFSSSGVKIEVLAQILESIQSEVKEKGGWSQVAKSVEGYLNMNEKQHQSFTKSFSKVYDLDALEELIPEDPKCAQCGHVAEHRCSQCKNEWYCSRDCQVKAWPKHKSLCQLIQS